jgi:hypothetical protein
MYKVYQLIYKKIQENLKSYIKGGEIEEKTSLHKLKITLTNVRIKKSALSSLMIPLVVQNTSKIKSLRLSISNTPKLKLVVEGLHLALNPSSLKNLNSDNLKEQKQARLLKWEKNKIDSLKITGTFGKKLADWLLPTLLTRVKVELKNLTFIYQDSQNLQILGFPCLGIVKIEYFAIFRDQKVFDIMDKKSEIKAKVTLNNASVILRCDPVHYEQGTTVGNIYDEMKISERSYFLRPCSFTADFKVLNEVDGTCHYRLEPKMTTDLQFAINEYQRMFLEGFLNFLENSSKANRYSFLKPRNSAKSSPGEWWKFLVKSFKYDLRFNINKVLRMHSTKLKYIELYKRVQTIIKAPVLIKLGPTEEAEMKSIEESLMFEEIVKFREDALKQIINKISKEKKAKKSEDVKKKMEEHEAKQKTKTIEYVKDCYNEFKTNPQDNVEIPDETSEEVENSKPKNKFSVIFEINRVVFSINLLKAFQQQPITLLDTQDCKCVRCAPLCRENELKSSRNSKFRTSKMHEVPDRVQINPERKIIRLPNEYSLLPNRKMKDVIIESGDEVFKIGSLCFKTRGGEAYEENIVKEITIIFLLIDNVTMKVSGNLNFDLIDCNFTIDNVIAFDPLLCSCPSLNRKTSSKISSFQDFLNFPGWFDYIFRLEEENKAHWALRHFMKDKNCLAEFEFWLHFKEFNSERDLCLCGFCYKSEQTFKEAFLFNEQNPYNNIHDCKQSFKGNNLSLKTIETIANQIQENIMKFFPFFLQVALRYIISGIFPKILQQNSIECSINIAREKNEEEFEDLEKEEEKYGKKKNKKKEKVVVVFDGQVQNFPVKLTTDGLSCLKLFLTADKGNMQPKSIFKKNFIETLEDLPKRLLMIKQLMKNTERSERILKALTEDKLMNFPEFDFNLNLKSLNLSLSSHKSQENLEFPATFSLLIKDLHLRKDISGSFRDSEVAFDPQMTQNYVTFKSSIGSVILSSNSKNLSSDSKNLSSDSKILSNDSKILSTDSKIPSNESKILSNDSKINLNETKILIIENFQLLGNLNPFSNHPYQPSLLLDIHVQTVRSTLDRSIMSLVHILNSLATQTSENELASFNHLVSSDFRKSESEDLIELRQAIENCRHQGKKPKNNKRNTKEDFFKRVKKNLLDENLKSHEFPGKNCKHCVIHNVKLLFVINFAVGSMDEGHPEGLVVTLKDAKDTYFDLACKHLFVKVEETPMIFKLSVISSKITGNSPSRDSVLLKPGGSKMQPVILSSHCQFFPLTRKYYLSSSSSFAYQLASMTRNFYKTSEKSNENCFDFRRSVSNVAKIKVPDMEIHEHEARTEVLIKSIFVTLNLKSKKRCLLIEGLLKLAKWVKLANCLIEKKDFKVFRVQCLSESLLLKVSCVKVSCLMGGLEVEGMAHDVDVNVLPVCINPPFNQLLFKGKDTEADLTYSVSVHISSITLELENVLQVFIRNFELMQSDMRHSKGKVLNKVFTCSSTNSIEKLEIKVQSVQVFSEETLLLAIPGELYKNTLMVSRGNSIEVRLDKSQVWHINIPKLAVYLQIESLKKVLTAVLTVPKIDIKPAEAKTGFIIDLSKLHQKSKETRICLIFTDFYSLLECRGYLILTLKMHFITLLHNLPKGELESHNFSNVKEFYNDLSNIYTNSQELALVCKSLEVVPNNSLFKNMVDSKDFSISVHIELNSKKISIKALHKVRAVVINKVFEELLLAIKDLKSVKAKKLEPDRDNFTLAISLNLGEVIIPRHSKSEEHAKISFNSAKVKVKTGDAEIRKPSEIDENALVFNEKEVIHQVYEEPATVYCDLVTVEANDAQIETFILKEKSLGSVENITVNITSPAQSEDLKYFSWKTDSIVDVNFTNAELTASLVIFK